MKKANYQTIAIVGAALLMCLAGCSNGPIEIRLKDGQTVTANRPVTVYNVASILYGDEKVISLEEFKPGQVVWINTDVNGTPQATDLKNKGNQTGHIATVQNY